MTGDRDKLGAASDWEEIVRKIRARTPARIFVKRAPAYTTKMELELRYARADAVDAVWSEFDLAKDFPAEFVARWNLFEVASLAESKSQYLLRPDLGRRLSDGARESIRQRCSRAPDVQLVIGAGLSGAAVREQVPGLFSLVADGIRARGWSIGAPFAVRSCRVGIMNDIGDLLAPRVLVLLIGERPGLATARSLSAYLAYCPGAGHSNAERNVISNIHSGGIRTEQAAERIIEMAGRMMDQKKSGTLLKDSAANELE